MLHKAWNSNGEVPYCFPRSSIKFQGHTGQNITDFYPNWAFPDYRPVAAFKSLRFALLMQQFDGSLLIWCHCKKKAIVVHVICELLRFIVKTYWSVLLMSFSVISLTQGHHIDGLVQDCSNSRANAMELLQSALSHPFDCPSDESWIIWVNSSHQSTKNYDVAITKLNTTKHVYNSWGVLWIDALTYILPIMTEKIVFISDD